MKNLNLDAAQIDDLESLIDYLNDEEIDDFQENWRECLEPLKGSKAGKELYESAYADLEKKVDDEAVSTAEEMEALARVSKGHVYCSMVRLNDLLNK